MSDSRPLPPGFVQFGDTTFYGPARKVGPDTYNGIVSVVVGSPPPDDESHDCDAMGCGSMGEHVLKRTIEESFFFNMMNRSAADYVRLLQAPAMFDLELINAALRGDGRPPVTAEQLLRALDRTASARRRRRLAPRRFGLRLLQASRHGMQQPVGFTGELMEAHRLLDEAGEEQYRGSSLPVRLGAALLTAKATREAQRDNEALHAENKALRGTLKAAQDALKAAQERRAEPDDALFRVVFRRMFDLALKHEGREGLKALLRELDEVAR